MLPFSLSHICLHLSYNKALLLLLEIHLGMGGCSEVRIWA